MFSFEFSPLTRPRPTIDQFLPFLGEYRGSLGGDGRSTVDFTYKWCTSCESWELGDSFEMQLSTVCQVVIAMFGLILFVTQIWC